MSKKERLAVALLVIASMVVGLGAVDLGLDRAQSEQDAIMARAASNVGELPQQAQPEQSEAVMAPVDDPEQPAQQPPQEEVTDQQTDQPESEQSELEQPVPEEPQVGAALLNALETGDFSTIGVLSELGLLDDKSRPSMETTHITQIELAQWLQTQSMDALTAQAALEGAQAMAAGVNTGDNPKLRAFAQSQGPANYQAEQNRLAEQAMELSMNYLSCQQKLAVWEENLAFYQQLEQQVTAQLEASSQKVQTLVDESSAEGADDTQTVDQNAMDAQAELNAVKLELEMLPALVAQAEDGVKQAKEDLEKAAQDILQAAGMSSDQKLEFEGEMTVPQMPETDGATAAAAAQESRNEMKKAAYQIIQAEDQLTQMRYQYPPDAPEVVAQQAALSQAQAEIQVLAEQLEQDMLQRHEKLTALSQALAQPAPEQPAESYAAANGGTNVMDLMDSWNTYIDAKLQRIDDTADMNLQALQFEHAMGVGVESIEIAG